MQGLTTAVLEAVEELELELEKLGKSDEPEADDDASDEPVSDAPTPSPKPAEPADDKPAAPDAPRAQVQLGIGGLPGLKHSCFAGERFPGECFQLRVSLQGQFQRVFEREWGGGFGGHGLNGRDIGRGLCGVHPAAAQAHQEPGRNAEDLHS